MERWSVSCLEIIELSKKLAFLYNNNHIGLFSNIMRDMANTTNDYPKWIVLDGDIDPMWIESLNTVMDDNKVISVFKRT